MWGILHTMNNRSRIKHRRYRQIGRLLYHYCCVKYLTRKDGRWVKDTVWCPVCDGDGEFITEDDVYTCSVCDGIGEISMSRYKQWIKEME